ncbi:hypothetical protein GOODEAATRI_006745 [Goodea atripinnis]|uniref:Uncharacterized protein n=1 Tax=Goodea atripinnis TaxID=208336 RepID=A0ABV0MZ95_9TELE
MDGSHCCMDCGAVLLADDGHDLCPTCLGRDHLVEALSENPCMNCSFMPRALRVARLAQLCPQDDADLPPSGQVAPFGRSKRRVRGRSPTPFSVLPSEEYLREMHACWRDPRALSCLSTDGRVLAAMHKSVKAGLDRMPAVEPAVASLIVSPDEALRPDVRCPRTQCRVTDDILCKAYNAGAGAGRLGNSTHLMFALSASLQDAGGATAAVGFSDAALQPFALMTRELTVSCLFSSKLVDRSGWRSLLWRKRAVGPSGMSQSCWGCCSDQQLWRHWSELFRGARLASSFLASAGVCPFLLLSA